MTCYWDSISLVDINFLAWRHRRGIYMYWSGSDCWINWESCAHVAVLQFMWKCEDIVFRVYKHCAELWSDQERFFSVWNCRKSSIKTNSHTSQFITTAPHSCWRNVSSRVASHPISSSSQKQNKTTIGECDGVSQVRTLSRRHLTCATLRYMCVQCARRDFGWRFDRGVCKSDTKQDRVVLHLRSFVCGIFHQVFVT